MSEYVVNTIRILGSRESVAEVAMFLCQDHRVGIEGVIDPPGEHPAYAVRVHIGHEQELLNSRFSLKPLGSHEESTNQRDAVLVESLGMRAVARDHLPAAFELTLKCETEWQPPWTLLGKMSIRFPDVVIGTEATDAANCDWWYLTFSQGRTISNLKVENVPGFAGRERELILDPLGMRELSTWSNQKFEETASQLFENRAGMRFSEVPSHLADHGWPRWSLLNHAAFSSGLEAFDETFSDYVTADEIEQALDGELEASKQLGVASWVDGVLFGPSVQEDGQPLFCDLGSDQYAERHLQLLGKLSEATLPSASPISQALLASLSKPFVRLCGGLHPVVFLTAAAVDLPRGAPARVGLDALLKAYADQAPTIRGAETLDAPLPQNANYEATPLDAVLRSSLAIAALPRVSVHQLKPALAHGVTDTMLLWTLLARGLEDEGFLDPSNLNPNALDSLVDVYGSEAEIPDAIKQAIASRGPSLQLALESRLTASAMADLIADRTGKSEPERVAPRRRAKV
ncbi:hypothetical protein [Paucibacter soli]|uniref:hypothetical protein n=1 Tax=Paucibacter soli TaxID=3133433 RepID=UPI0030A680C2